MFTEFKKNHMINTNFLCYIGLCNATSKHWRKAFSRDNENDLVVTEHEQVQPFEILPPQLPASTRVMYLSLSKNLHQKFVLLMLDLKIRKLRRYTLFHSKLQKT